MTDKFNIARFALERASALDSKVALRFYRGRSIEEEVTYAQLQARVAAATTWLAELGIRPGTPVILRLESSPTFAVVGLAVLAAGGVLVPLSNELTDEKVRFVAADIRAEYVISPRAIEGLDTVVPIPLGNVEATSPIAFSQTPADAPALVVYTSGTTSSPKGVVHAHRMALGRAPMREGWTDLRESDVLAHAGKLNWTYAFGLCLIDALSTGATAVIAQDAKATDWGPIVRHSGATILAGVPSFYRQLLKYDDPSDFAGLRHALCAGESLRPELLTAWVETTGAPIFEALGMSECSTYVSCSPTIAPRAGSAGKAQPGRRVAVLPIDDDGEEPVPLATGEIGLLAVHRSDPGLMLGYHERPDEDAKTRRGEWFCGGDLARIDADGYVWFEGRNDELMNSFGYRVSPAEVEAVICEAPGVAAVAVAERQVRSDVSVVCAYVVRSPGSNITRDDVLSYATQRLARYKAPREVIFIAALPRNANGKLSRKLLADLEPS